MNRTSRKSGKTVTTRRIRNEGVERLSKAADDQVKQHFAVITDGLVEAAKKGNVSSVRLLLELADGADWIHNSETVQGLLSTIATLDTIANKELDGPEKS